MLINYYNTTRLTEPNYTCSTSDTDLAFVCSTSDTSLASAYCYHICKGAFDTQQLENMLKDNLLVYIHELYRLLSSAMLLPYTDTEIRDLQINHNTYYAVRM